MIYRFDDIAYNITTKRVPTPDDNARYIGLEHLDPGELYVKRYGSNVDLKGDKLVMTKGDILFGKRNTYLKRVAIAPFDGLFSAHGMIFHPKEDVIDKRYFPFFINSDAFMDEAIRISVGSLSPTVNWKDLKDLKFDIPPIEEQKQIADKLWIAYDLKSKYANLVESIDEMVKSQFIEMFGDPVTNSKGWPTKPLSEVAPESPSRHQIEGIVWNLNLDMIESNSGKVISKIYEEVNRLLSVSQFDQGNVLFSKLRPYLNKVVVPDEIGYATTELVPLRPDQELLNKYFLAHLLRGHHFVSYANAIATGTKMPRMPMNSLRSFKCILPPMELQQQFVDIAEQADKSKFELRKSIEAIDKVIKSLINS